MVRPFTRFEKNWRIIAFALAGIVELHPDAIEKVMPNIRPFITPNQQWEVYYELVFCLRCTFRNMRRLAGSNGRRSQDREDNQGAGQWSIGHGAIRRQTNPSARCRVWTLPKDLVAGHAGQARTVQEHVHRV